MSSHEKINYVEFPAKHLEATKTFFSSVFGWEFIDYGEEYVAFTDNKINGGFFKSDQVASTQNGSVLIVFYSNELEYTQAKVESADGQIVQPIFSFPGGRRFHFTDPNGNEFAVWSDRGL